MARRRLHGATQKRRKKKSTRALKRQESVVRVQSTHQPAPFQRSGELEGQDIIFLEVMRDMGVNRFPRAGETPARQENFERVHFAAQQGEQDQFTVAMDSLGVTPLQKTSPKTPRKPPRNAGQPKDRTLPKSPPGSAVKGVAASAPPGGTAPRNSRVPQPVGAASAAFPGSLSSGADDGGAPLEPSPATTPEVRAAKAPPAEKPPGNPAGNKTRKKPRAVPFTRFEWNEADGGLLAEALRLGKFDPADKYEGAPKRPRPAPRPEQPREMEPDGELDLHGKTQEEAIRMVQNFLLTSHRQKLREVLIITGKGLNSGEGGPVLREAVNNWLERNGGRFAKSFGWAPSRHGGDGAIWVSLR